MGEEVEIFKDKYFKSKAVHIIMKLLSDKTKIPLEKLYIQIGWPLYKIYGHAYDALKDAMKYNIK